MNRLLRFRAIFKFYEKVHPFLKYTLHVESKIPFDRALVLAPHMDDESIGCGGTLVKLRKLNKKTTVLFFTKDTDERKAEAEKACAVLGVRPLFLGYQGETLSGNIAKAGADIQKAINDNKSDAVFVPFFLDNHIDHRALNLALVNVKFTGMIYAYPVWSPLYPNVLIDITSEWEEKKNAIECYKTQLAGRDYVKMSHSLGQYWAIAKGRNMEVVETFLRLSLKDYLKLIK